MGGSVARYLSGLDFVVRMWLYGPKPENISYIFHLGVETDSKLTASTTSVSYRLHDVVSKMGAARCE